MNTKSPRNLGQLFHYVDYQEAKLASHEPVDVERLDEIADEVEVKFVMRLKDLIAKNPNVRAIRTPVIPPPGYVHALEWAS